MNMLCAQHLLVIVMQLQVAARKHTAHLPAYPTLNTPYMKTVHQAPIRCYLQSAPAMQMVMPGPTMQPLHQASNLSKGLPEHQPCQMLLCTIQQLPNACNTSAML
jgi:hypothetical protein